MELQISLANELSKKQMIPISWLHRTHRGSIFLPILTGWTLAESPFRMASQAMKLCLGICRGHQPAQTSQFCSSLLLFLRTFASKITSRSEAHVGADYPTKDRSSSHCQQMFQVIPNHKSNLQNFPPIPGTVSMYINTPHTSTSQQKSITPSYQ